MSSHLAEVCTSYSVCGILMSVQEIDWMTVGAFVLLLARLVKDVPDAYDAVRNRLIERKETKHDKSN